MIEEAKKVASRPEPSKGDKLAAVRKEAADKVDAMTNKEGTAYYRYEDSVATIEERIDLVSTVEASTLSPKSQITTTTSINNLPNSKRKILNHMLNNNILVTSSITIESLLSKQSQIEAQLDKVDVALR